MGCFNRDSKEYKSIENKFGKTTHFILNGMKVEDKIPTIRQVNSFIDRHKKEVARELFKLLRSNNAFTPEQIAANLKGIIHKHEGQYFITKGASMNEFQRMESERTIFEPNLKIMRAFEKQFPNVFTITKVGRFKNTFRVDIKPSVESFDVNLAQKIQNKLEKLYPEIKLNTNNNPKWEQGSNIFNQEEYNNQINYRLKAVDILTSKKAEQIFNKGEKNNWDLNKILSELQVPKEQKQIILNSDFGGFYTNELSLRDNIVMSLMVDNSFVVEINTATGHSGDIRHFENFEGADGENTRPDFTIDDYTYRYHPMMDGPVKYLTSEENNFNKDLIEITEEEYFNARNNHNSEYYSYLTVPGGTNYTENEITTPAITPGIKGHAQFSTDKGIGWFRSDEKSQLIDNNKEVWHILSEDGFSEFNSEEEAKNALPNYPKDAVIHKLTEEDKWGGIPITKDVVGSKTRRILEVQSDLFQKGRDKKDLLQTIQTRPDITDETILAKINQEIEQDDTGFGIGNEIIIDGVTYERNAISGKWRYKEFQNVRGDEQKNKFLQLLNQKNNWVTFFVKSIIQDSAKKGYKKVLFPKGDTASNIEGHQTLEEFKKQKEARIKELENKVQNIKERGYLGGLNSVEQSDEFGDYIQYLDQNNRGDFEEISKEEYDKRFKKYSKQELEKTNTEISTLKQELADIESGRTQLGSIANFYENTITNILKKNGYNPVEITDEYDNKWNEIVITPEVLSEILLQRNEANQIIGQANIEAMTVLVDAVNQKQDTLPHEYAHHYIAWYRNTPIVQEAIKKWGSEEALVQSIGEQVVAQKGEAYNWWNKFINWIMNQFNSVSKLDKDRLTKILTDAFLTRQDLGYLSFTVSGVSLASLISQEEYNELSKEEIEAIKKCN